MEINNITEAIIAVSNEIKKIGKNTLVGTGSSAYKAVSDTDVKVALRELMSKNGLVIFATGINTKVQIDRWEEVDIYSKDTPKPMKSKQSVFTEVEAKYLLLHTSGQSIELAGYGQGVDTQDKGAGKATTYALKNVLLNLFLIPTGEDTDKTHSDDMDVPKKTTEKKWYNLKDGDLDKIQDKLIDTGKTPQDYINGLIKAGYSIGKETKEKILTLG